MAAAEAAPLAKVGGLGDVVGALPKELKRLGAEIKIIIPFYGSIDQKKFPVAQIGKPLTIVTGGGKETFSVWHHYLGPEKIEIILLRHRFFDGQEVYRGGRVGSHDRYTRTPADIKRFAFFSAAALAAIKTLGWQPDVIHCHDWHTALIPDLLKTVYKNERFFSKTRTLYTIHNLANQGMVGPEIIGFTKIDPTLPSIRADLKNGDLNFMVQGILGADLVNTVSPTYSKEILHHYQGAGIEKILRKRKKSLSGILNGIDTELFNPATDPLIAQNYTFKTIKNKTINKSALEKAAFWQKNKTPIVGLVSRLVWQKGLELIDDVLLELPCRFVILGSGNKDIEDKLLGLAKKYPDKFFVKIGFDLKLAQLIYAGSDIFLMPSQFEPCGLSQMVAMRYGTIPVVRKTGGLADTVNKLNGFAYLEQKQKNLIKALKSALDTYSTKPDKWLKLQKKGMDTDFSWGEAAKKYLRIYNKLILANIK